jgi:hypothetical protein
LSSIVSGRGAYARWAVLLLTMVLAACYPRYNWRELPVADGLAVLAFPARIDVAQREVVLAGLKVNFVLTSAKVDDSLFSFGYAQLPPESARPAREAARQALIDSLAKGMGQEAPASAQEGTVFKLVSAQGESPLVVFARVVLHHDVVMRVVASGPPTELTDEIAREFMRSLVLR